MWLALEFCTAIELRHLAWATTSRLKCDDVFVRLDKEPVLDRQTDRIGRRISRWLCVYCILTREESQVVSDGRADDMHKYHSIIQTDFVGQLAHKMCQNIFIPS